jgi:hypothetical protein
MPAVMGAPGRCEIIGAVLVLLGVFLSGRSLWRLVQASRAKFTYGAPYRSGLAADRAFGLFLTLPFAPVGCLLVLLGLGQQAFQETPAGQPVRVGRVEARRSGWGRTRIQLAPDPLYPEQRLLEGEIEGARWAVSGDFISWSPGVRWLGLRPGHRVRSLVASADSTGMSSGASRPIVPIDALPRAASTVLRLRRFLPFLSLRQGTSTWFEPAERRIVILYATREGYVADDVAER